MMFALFCCLSRLDDGPPWPRTGRLCVCNRFLRFTSNSRARGSNAAIAFSIFFRSFLNSARTRSIFKGSPQELEAFLSRECQGETQHPVLFHFQNKT